MKKILLLIPTMFLVTRTLLAQLPDFTHDDCNAVSHHLFADLQAGNAVILDFSARWCPPCHAAAPVMEQVYKDFGSGNCKVKQYLMLFDGLTPNVAANCNDGHIFATQHEVTSPVLTDIGSFYTGITGQYMQLYNTGGDDVGNGDVEAGVPFFMVILPNPANPASSIVKRILGNYENLEDVIKNFLSQGGFFPPPPITLQGDLCTDQPFTATLTSGFQGGNILWSTNQTTPSIIVNQTGTYSVTDNTGCTATKYVEFNHLPVMGTASISGNAVCEQGFYTIDYNIPPNGETNVAWEMAVSPNFEWAEFNPFGDGTLPANAGPLTFLASDPAGTIYKFRVKGANGTGIEGNNCFSYSNEVEITINNSQPTTIPGTASASKDEVCQGSDYTLNYNGGVQNSFWEYYDYFAGQWLPFNYADNSLTVNAGFPSVDINGLPGATFRVKSPDADCYALSNEVHVTFLPSPPQPTITGPDLVCQGSGNITLQIDNSYQSILWSPGGQSTSSIIVSPTATTTYSVTVTGNNGCTSGNSHPVYIMSNPVPFVTATPPGAVCAGDAVTLSFGGTKSIACTNDVFGQYPEDAFSFSTSDGTPEQITLEGYAGEYSMINVQSGNYYYLVGTNSSAVEDCIVTVTNSDGSIVYATGLNIAIWKATFTGQVRFYTHRPNCGSSDAILIARIGACSPDATVFGTFSWSPGGATTPSINVNPAANTSYSVTFTNTYFPEVLGACSGAGTLQIQVGSTKTWVLDNDNDNYYTGTTKSQCTSPGAGYVVKINQQPGDCNDNNALINPATIWYKDVDNDGYSDGTTLTQCTRPTKYKLATELTATSGDCNDNNATIHGLQTYYFDADKDGYGDPARSTSVCSLTPPTGYLKDNTDCNDNDKAIHAPKLYYVDADHDGYGSTATTTLCLSKAPSGYSINNTDCNDNDAGIHSPKTYYVDDDLDGYGSQIAVLLCTSQPPAGYSINNTDCNDDNASIHPNAMEICGNGIDDNCNGKIDENCTVCQNATGLTTSNITSSSAQLNWTASTNPVQWQVDYKKSSSSSWKSVVLSGTVRSVNIASLSSNQTYNWRIRALCGKTWTSYSSIINFNTLSSNNITSQSLVQPLAEAGNSSATLQLYPNPNNGQFVIRLNVQKEINGNASIQLVDMLGRIVQSVNGNVSYGHLEKTITLPARLTRGIYMTRIIVNDKAYQTKLIYQ